MPAKKKVTTASNVFAILGSDEAMVADQAHALVDKLTPEGSDDFANDIIEGAADNAEHASKIVSQTIQAIQTLPFFGGAKVVWLKGANFLGDNITGKAQQTVEAVENLKEELKRGIPSDVQFVLSTSVIDKRRGFYKELNRVATIKVFDKPDVGRDGWEEQVMGIVLQRARKHGLEFSSEILEAFVMLVGEDTRQIDSELEKLSIYLGQDRVVTLDAVKAIVSSSRGGVIWELGGAIERRDIAGALGVIDHQLKRGENAIGLLLAAIVPRVRSLLFARDLMERFSIRPQGRNFRGYESQIARLPPAETAHLPRKKDGSVSCYPLFLAGPAAERFSAYHLRQSLKHCLEANRKLVQTSLDHRLVLSQLVIRILS